MRASDSLGTLDRLWPGPRPYGEDRAADFVGRNSEIGAALDRINGQRLTVLQAPSAAGKTSLLQAGIVPELRYARLEALEMERSPSGRPFPLLLNQWLGRVGPGRTLDFAKLLLLEAHRHLTACRGWYKAEMEGAADHPGYSAAVAMETASIDHALDGLARLAAAEGFASRGDDGALAPLVSACLERVDDQQITDLLLKIDAVLSESFTSIVLILDQFEEVLGDAVLGRQAIIAVDSTFKLCPDTVRQLISMRHDSAHLLEPLEARGTLDQKRVMPVYPLTPERVTDIVKEVSAEAGVTWTPDALSALIRAFTDEPEAGKGRRDVNLLGLQVVLKSLFAAFADDGANEIDIDRVLTLCVEIAGAGYPKSVIRGEWLEPHDEVIDGETVRVGAILASAAPRRWIERSLSGVALDQNEAPALPDGIAEGEFAPALIKPMVARMSLWLVTPTGFKRPLTGGELRDIAYEADLEGLREADLAGRAVRDGLTVDVEDPRLRQILDNTFRVALHRLVDVGHVLKGRGSDREASYELVHDQFGKPLQAWAAAFLRTPESDLGSLYAIDDVRLKWGRLHAGEPRAVLRESLMELSGSSVLDRAKWRGCTISGIDFSGVTILAGDFSRSEFVDCAFDEETVFEGSTLWSTLFRACEFDGSRFASGHMDSVAFRGGTRLRGVEFAGGSMVACIFRDVDMSDCAFRGTANDSLGMRNALIVNSEITGNTAWECCSLNGATIGTEAEEGDEDGLPSIQPGDMVLRDCDMRGIEMQGLDFGGNTLLVERCEARGAVFTDVDFDDLGPGRAEFHDVDLTGAVFVGCSLPRARFEGAARDRGTGAPAMTPCATVVFKGVPGLPASLSGTRFANLQMDNFTISDCELTGDVEFESCQLSGGTIVGDPESENDVAHVRGCLRFHSGCDLAALEMNGLDFSEGTIEVVDSAAPSLLFLGVNLPEAPEGKHRILLSGCEMPGLLFLDCAVHGLVMEKGSSNAKASAPTLIVRGGNRFRSFGNCVFHDADLENFTFENVVVNGPLWFTGCALSGGTVGGYSDEAQGRQPLRVEADMAFADGCDLAAVELRTVDFIDSHLTITDSACDGMILIDVTSESVVGRPGIEITDTSLNGVVVLGSRIAGLTVTGSRDRGSLTTAWGLTIRSGSTPMVLGDAAFTNMDLDGLVVKDVRLEGPVTLTGCTLLRSLFADIQAGNDAACIDVRESDLLFTQVDEPLRAAASTAHPILQMDPGQLKGASRGAETLKHIKHGA